MADYDLYNDLSQKTKQLGSAYAAAEYEYKKKLRIEALKLREEGMAIGMIEMTVKGVDAVANARFKRDVAEVSYKATQDEINAIKLQMRLLEAQISREWGISV